MGEVFCTQKIEWIKLSDELPPSGEEVLLTDFNTTISGRVYVWENDEGGED